MIDPEAFARRQMELTVEFSKYVLDHPDVDATLPQDAYIYFRVDDDPEFDDYSRQLAERREREDGVTAVRIHSKGLAPPQGSRLVDPRIIIGSTVGSKEGR